MATIKSIEEKAKAYDEAIERAKSELNSPDKRLIEYIFPELKESEDERIKKEIVNFICWATDRGSITSEQREKSNSWLAWLEKLGEQKLNPVLDIEIPLGAKDSELQEVSYYIPEGFHAEIEGNRVVIKKGEQKPTEEYNITGIKSKHAQGKLGEMIKNLKPVNEVLEQRPADNQFTPEQAGILDKHIDKFLEQNPWSEEDEKEVAVLEAYIRSKDWSERHVDRALGIVDELANKVKSLRPQSTWKPSDEHYELEEFAKIVRGNLTGISKAVQELFKAKYLQLTGRKMYGGFKD